MENIPNKEKNPRVSIVILNYNGFEDTIRCLESLKKITYPNYEIIVVDNNSKGNDADILEKKYKEYIKLIRNKENLGFSGGNNIAIKEILKEDKSKYILLLNNDTVVDREFLEELVKVGEGNKKIGSCQAKILSLNKPKIIDAVGIGIKKDGSAYQRGWQEDQNKKYKNIFEIFGACACAALYKIEMFNQIGLFDEDFFAYYEDVDLSWRARLFGWKCIYVPKSVVYHIHSATGASLKDYFLARNELFYKIKNAPIDIVIFSLIKSFFSIFILFLTKWGNVKKSAIFKGKLSAFTHIPKMIKKRKEIQSTGIVNLKEFKNWLKLS